MKPPIENSTTSMWWTRNITSWIYFVRELTGLGIAFYMVFFVLAFYFDPMGQFVTAEWFYWVSWLGLVSALFHSVTWFAVTLKVIPFEISPPFQRIGFFVILLIWGLFSLFVMEIFYVGETTYVFYGF